MASEILKPMEIMATLLYGSPVLDLLPKLTDRSFENSKIKILKFLESSPTDPYEQEQRLVYGVVIRPNAVDGHLDIMTEREVEKTAHRFLANGGSLADMHKKGANAVVVESYIAPIDFPFGNGEIRKGDWVVVSLVIDDDLWEKIKSGELIAYSPGGKSRARILI